MKEFLKKLLKQLNASISLFHYTDYDWWEEGCSSYLCLDYTVKFNEDVELNSSVDKDDLSDLEFRTYGDDFSAHEVPNYGWEDDYSKTPTVDEFVDTYLTDTACMKLLSDLFNPNLYYGNKLEKVLEVYNNLLKDDKGNS